MSQRYHLLFIFVAALFSSALDAEAAQSQYRSILNYTIGMPQAGDSIVGTWRGEDTRLDRAGRGYTIELQFRESGSGYSGELMWSQPSGEQRSYSLTGVRVGGDRSISFKVRSLQNSYLFEGRVSEDYSEMRGRRTDQNGRSVPFVLHRIGGPPSRVASEERAERPDRNRGGESADARWQTVNVNGLRIEYRLRQGKSPGGKNTWYYEIRNPNNFIVKVRYKYSLNMGNFQLEKPGSPDNLILLGPRFTQSSTVQTPVEHSPVRDFRIISAVKHQPW